MQRTYNSTTPADCKNCTKGYGPNDPSGSKVECIDAIGKPCTGEVQYCSTQTFCVMKPADPSSFPNPPPVPNSK